jgi:hypothetical protein
MSDPDPVRQIADAVLYEGYILWPYRRSALKNAKRWTFGGVYPKAYSEAGHEDDAWTMQTQCLIEGGDEAHIDVRVRFLHLVERKVGKRSGEGFELVDELAVGGERHLSWQEAREREVGADAVALGELLESGRRIEVAIPAGRREDPLVDPEGECVGALLRSWRSLAGTVEIGAERLREGVCRLTVRIANTTPWDGGTREDALERTFASTHTTLRTEGGSFVSLADPPEEFRQLAEQCLNVGTWPVPVGEQGDRHTLLSSPIILEDYPRIAPQSPGDLFDGGEIDELLTLNILSLTEEEKREMRDSDPRTREILARTESLTPEQMISLHGAMRELRTIGPS